MNINKFLLLLLILFLTCSISYKEYLRIQGSWNIRGYPYIPYNPYISPWLMGTSFPKRNRQIGNFI